MTRPVQQPTPPARRSRRHLALAAIATMIALALSGCGSGHHSASPTTTTTTTTEANSDTSTTTPPSIPTTTTSTTVQGPSGPPADFPAAKPTPPSLAGAYPTGTTVDLITVIKTLTTYEDWVWSHPNPGLVSNYELRTGTAYAGELQAISEFRRMGIHAEPTPTEIDFVRVVTAPRPQAPLPNGKPRQLNGYQWFIGGVITVVETNKTVPMLTENGTPSGHQFNPTHLGPTAYSISLVQGPDGHFRIEDSSELNPPGGIASVEGGQ